MHFVDRAITDQAFPTGRDIGIAIHNNYPLSPQVEWAVGLFNGTGDIATLVAEADPMTGDVSGDFSNIPTNVQPALVVRLGYNRGGIVGYSETDFEGGPLRFGIGGSALIAFDVDGDNESGVSAELDGIIKSHGLSASGGVYFTSNQDGDDFVNQGHSGFGVHAQAGYLIGGNIEPALRYAIVKLDGATASHEITGALSIFEFKHGLQWQSDMSLLGTSSAVTCAVRARTQIQLTF